jgi:hypothetical protein
MRWSVYYLQTIQIPLCRFLSPNASDGSWTQTLDLKMLEQVLYHCATPDS